MNITEVWSGSVDFIGNSAIFRGTVWTGTALLLVIGILIIMLCVTFLLRIFFRHHPVVNRMHKTLIYLLTMAGVLALLIAGFIFSMVPLIPGFVFVFIALLLMRRYHRWVWLDKKIAYIARQVKRTTIGKRYYAWRKRVREAHLRRREERLRAKQLKIQEKLNKLRTERREVRK